jgi:hypothetical protein
MNSHRLIPLVVSVAVVALLAGCDRHDYDTGELRSETRQVGKFDAIDMDGSAQLDITVGPDESLSINGSAASVAHTEAEVRGTTLHVKTSSKDWGWNGRRSRVIVRITVPALSTLNLRGGNDVKLKGFRGGVSRVDIDGAARLYASGELDELTVDMEGAGFADLSELVAADTRVTVDGIGKVIVHAKETLNATMNGIGAILYVGTPREVNTHMNGFGTISQRGHDKAERKRQKEIRKLEKERRHRERNTDDTYPAPRTDDDADAQPEIDPDKLQPEYDNRPKEPITMTEVV